MNDKTIMDYLISNSEITIERKRDKKVFYFNGSKEIEINDYDLFYLISYYYFQEVIYGKITIPTKEILERISELRRIWGNTKWKMN